MTRSFNVWRSAFSLLVEAGKGLAVLVAFLTFAEAVLGLAVLWLIKSLLETLNTEGLQQSIYLHLALIVGNIVLLGFTTTWAGYLRTFQGIKVAEVVDRHIQLKSIHIDFGFYESPAYFDSLERARQAGSQRPTQMINNVLMLLKSIAFVLGAAVLLATIEWRILPALFVSVLATLVVRLNFTKSLFEWKKSRAQLERRANYTDLLITAEWHAKEVRLGDMGPTLLTQYTNTRGRINTEQMEIERRKAKAELAVSLLAATVFATATVLLLSKDSNSSEAIPNLVLFVLLFRRAETSGRDMVQSLAKLYDDGLFLQQLFDFLTLEGRVVRPACPTSLPDSVIGGLRFEDVFFAYPNRSEPVIKGLSMELPIGKTIALVGENGTGKTTLTKLLTRLYDPNSGRITLDGIDTREFDPEAYRRRLSVVFQAFTNYALSLRQNVAAGDMAGVSDDARVMDALERAGAAELVKHLPLGLDTQLTRVFEGGQELSIGQWQRIALARAFFRESDFLVLDEPSSALDPRAESELFEDLRERAGRRGILLISHRLSTVRMADYTYVLDGGRVIEEGTHDALANAGGRYAELFEVQARKYR